jgi:hypothetical protein
MKFKFFIFAILLFCTGINAQQKFSKPPKFIFGTWKIYRAEFVGGGTLITKQEIKNWIGKKLEIGETSFKIDKDFLYYDETCNLKKYKFETYKMIGDFGEIDVRGKLIGSDLKDAYKNQIVHLYPYCGKSPYFIEVTKKHELAVFYDNYFFFLRKSK